MHCGQCDKIDDVLYGDWPHQVKCPYTGELRWRGEECNIEFVPVKHGRWEHDVCSVCGEEWFDYGRMKPMRTDYCPGCGAKMDLEDVYGY